MTSRDLFFAGAVLLTSVCGAQESVNGPIATLKARSRIVVVDVVATDSKGNPVKGLKATDFTLLEDKSQQAIRHFDEHTAPAKDAAVASIPRMKMEPNTFTNVVLAPQGSALNVILIDALNTPVEYQPFLRANLGVLAQKLPANSRVAIFGLSNQLVLLQSFTSDPAVLRSILTQRRKQPGTTAIQATDSKGDITSTDSLVDYSNSVTGDGSFNPDSALNMFGRAVDRSAMDERVKLTLTAMSQIGQYLASLPGRKNLLWVTGSFPGFFVPDSDNAGSRMFDEASPYGAQTAKVMAEMARSQVSVYPIEARGIQTNGAYDASVKEPATGWMQTPSGQGHFERSTSEVEAAVISEHGTMEQVAYATGGHAFYGSNDIAGEATKAMDRGANYYTLTYVPTNTNWNGKARKIKVMVDGKKINLEYRTEYIALDRPVTANNQQTTPESDRTEASTIAATMRRGAPTPTEILFKILVTPSEVVMPPKESNDPKAQEKLAKISTKPQRRYRVDYAVDPADIHWTVDQGMRSATVEFMVIGYDSDGNVLNQTDKRIPLKLTEQNYAGALKGGLKFAQDLAMPAKGDFYLRVGVMDKATLRIGSVEVSTSALMMPKS